MSYKQGNTIYNTIFQLKCYIKFVILNRVKNLILISDRFFAIAQNDIFELAINISNKKGEGN
jgi:hypothetical protein